MEPKPLSPDFSVSGQIEFKDVLTVKNMGYQSIICNRPNGEDLAQTDFDRIKEIAAEEKLETFYLPIPSSGPTDKDVAAFKKAYESLPKPILAYCRSGGRSTALFRRAFGE